MKAQSIIPLILAGFATVANCEPAQAMRDAVTHEELSLKFRQVSQTDPMHNMKPAKGGDPSIVNQPQDLVASSDIISFGGSATLVPKRAILNIPAKLADRIKFQPGSKIMSWAEFFAQNRGWITTVEVSRVQAEGNQALAEEISDRVHKSSNLIVATYMGGPISVLPLKVPEEAAKISGETANAN